MFCRFWLTIYHDLNRWYHSLLTHILFNWPKWVTTWWVNIERHLNKNMHFVMIIFTFNPNYTVFVIIATANDCLIRFSNGTESLIAVLCLKLSVARLRWKFKMDGGTTLKYNSRGWICITKRSELNYSHYILSCVTVLFGSSSACHVHIHYSTPGQPTT